MEIKKTIGKVFAAVVIGFALMVLYTNAFPLQVKTGTEWVEYESNWYYCSYGMIYADNYANIDQGTKAEIRKTYKEWAEKYPNQYKFDEETDTFYQAKERYIYWKGFDISYN